MRVACLVILALVICAGGVRANAGPPRTLGGLEGVIVPEATREVRVLAEELRLDVRSGLAEADVTARYRLLHTGSQPVDLPLTFVTREVRRVSDPAAPSVELDGLPVAVERLSLADMFREHVERRLEGGAGLAAVMEELGRKGSFSDADWRALNAALREAGFGGISLREGANFGDYAHYRWRDDIAAVPYATVVAVARVLFAAEVAQVEQGWTGAGVSYLDPVDGREYEAQFYGAGELWFTNFAVRLEPGKPADLTVRYTHAAATDWERHQRPIYHYQYLLHPARSWGGFERLRIVVRLPQSVRLASSLPLQRVSGERGIAYAAELTGLPEVNLSLALMPRWRPQDSPGILALLVLLVGAGAMVYLRAAGLVADRRRNRSEAGGA